MDKFDADIVKDRLSEDRKYAFDTFGSVDPHAILYANMEFERVGIEVTPEIDELLNITTHGTYTARLLIKLLTGRNNE